MKKIVLASFILFTQVAFAQFNFGIKQELEKNTDYGYQTAVHGNTMFVYKSRVDNLKVYTKQPDASWQLTQTLSPSDKPNTTAADWSYGYSMALNDSNAIIQPFIRICLRKMAEVSIFIEKEKTGFGKRSRSSKTPPHSVIMEGKIFPFIKTKRPSRTTMATQVLYIFLSEARMANGPCKTLF